MAVNRVEQIHQLRAAALRAVERRAWKKALVCYQSLERLETTEGDWPRKAGEMCRKLHLVDQATVELTRARDLYTRDGNWLKAIAICRLILAIDPQDNRTQRKLNVLLFCQKSQMSSMTSRADARAFVTPPDRVDMASSDGGEWSANA